MEFCTFLHFFCIFLHFYLHMSGIFCTFAQDFNSEVHDSLNYYRLMDYPCVFRCQSTGRMFRVLECSNPNAPWGFYYYVYCGRKRVKEAQFATLEGAILYCAKRCSNVLMDLTEEGAL